MLGGVFRRSLLLLTICCGSAALARDTYLIDWQNRYPTSTLPDRMAVLTGRDCNICHHPPSLNSPGNCYRDDLFDLLLAGRTITAAIDELDAVDSDGDGSPNGEEATMPHANLPGEIGYNMGLVGSLGSDPCATDPNATVTGVLETPPPIVPTASQWGVAIMALMLLTAGTSALRRRPAAA